MINSEHLEHNYSRKEKILKIPHCPWRLPANLQWPSCPSWQISRYRLAGNFHGCWLIFRILSFLDYLFPLFSEFTILIFVAICKGISSTPGTSAFVQKGIANISLCVISNPNLTSTQTSSEIQSIENIFP